MRSTIAALFLVAFTCPGPALAETVDAAPNVVNPTDKWVVDWNESRCTAGRGFDDGGKPLTFIIKASARFGSYQIYLVRSGSFHKADEETRSVRFGDAAPLNLEWLDYGVDKNSIKAASLTPEQAERLKQSSQITLDAGRGMKTYVLGPVADVAMALERCREDLIKTWNGNADAPTNLSRRANINLLALFSSGDYPGDALRSGGQGTVAMTLLVNEQGRVADCVIEKTSGVATLDAQSCAVITERARFAPALDKNGKPAKDIFSQRVSWVLP